MLSATTPLRTPFLLSLSLKGYIRGEDGSTLLHCTLKNLIINGLVLARYVMVELIVGVWLEDSGRIHVDMLPNYGTREKCPN